MGTATLDPFGYGATSHTRGGGIQVLSRSLFRAARVLPVRFSLKSTFTMLLLLLLPEVVVALVLAWLLVLCSLRFSDDVRFLVVCFNLFSTERWEDGCWLNEPPSQGKKAHTYTRANYFFFLALVLGHHRRPAGEEILHWNKIPCAKTRV